jgi:hypothetical protein
MHRTGLVLWGQRGWSLGHTTNQGRILQVVETFHFQGGIVIIKLYNKPATIEGYYVVEHSGIKYRYDIEVFDALWQRAPKGVKHFRPNNFSFLKAEEIVKIEE